ncbi:unnamed protein product [Closterium sp. NIES-54]
MRQGRRGSSPSTGDVDSVQRQRPEKRAGSGVAADGDDADNSKRSKGAGGNQTVGGDVPAPDWSRSRSPRVDMMLKEKGLATVRLVGPQSRGGADGSAEGRTAAVERVQMGGSSSHAAGQKGPKVPRPRAPEVAPLQADVGGNLEAAWVQADAVLPTTHSATKASANNDGGSVSVGVQADAVLHTTHPATGARANTGPLSRALMAPLHPPSVAVADDDVPTPRVGPHRVAGPSTIAPCTEHSVGGPTPSDPVSAMLLAEINMRKAASPSPHSPASGPSAAPTTQHLVRSPAPSDPVLAMLLAKINTRQAAAPSPHPPTIGHCAAATTSATGPSAALTTVNLGVAVLQGAADEMGQAVPPHDQVGTTPEKNEAGVVAGAGGLGEMPIDPIFNTIIITDDDVIADDEVELIRGLMDADPLADQQTGGAMSANVAEEDRPAGASAANQAGQTGPSEWSTGVTTVGQDGVMAGQAGVSVAGQVGQTVPTGRSAGVTVADRVGTAGPSCHPAVVSMAGQADHTEAVAEQKKKRKGKAAASKKPVARKDRMGHGIRVDRTSAGRWQGEIHVAGKSRYTCRSDDRMEVAYLNGLAMSIFDRYVSPVLLDEMTGVKVDDLNRWKSEWEAAKVILKGKWMVMWAHGAVMFRARFITDLADFKQKTTSGPSLLKLLRPAVWFGTDPDPAKHKQQFSDIINRVSICAAFGPVAASALPRYELEATRLAEAVAASSYAVWCFAKTVATVSQAAGEGKAAALLCLASTDFADLCHSVVVAVMETEISRQAALGEVPCDVIDRLQSADFEVLC